MKHSAICWLLAAVACVVTFGAARAEDNAEAAPAKQPQVSYTRNVLPIFREHCHGCHQPARAQGAYVMTNFAALLRGGESEDPAVVPGKVDDSNLTLLIEPEDGKAEMPKGKAPLSDKQLDVIRRWIAAGAVDDTPEVAKKLVDADHPPEYRLPAVITSLDISPDGKTLATSGYHEALLHNIENLDAITPEPTARLIGLSERIESAVFSPDGKMLAVTGGQPGRTGELQVWDVASRKLKLSVPVTYDTIYGASWSADGTKIAFGCADNSVRVVTVKDGRQVLFSGAHTDWVLDTVFSVSSDHLVTVSRDYSMKLTEVATERFIDNITSITPGALKGGLTAVDRHPTKDELLIGGADGVPKIYRMFRNKARKIGDDFNLIRKFPATPGRIYTVEFSADGGRIVVGSSSNGSGEVNVYNANDAKAVSKLATPESGVYAATFSPDGRLVASGGFDGVVRISEAASGKVLKEFVPVPLAPLQATTTKD